MSVWISIIFLVGAAMLLVQTWKVSSRKKTATSPESAPDSSLRDPVTGLYNDRQLFRRLGELACRADREGQSLAVILWDIDGFVQFNNDHGQAEGDRLLKGVADTIRQSIRVYDEAFRSGADEFSALLYPADKDTLLDVVHRVKKHLISISLKEYIANYGRDLTVTSGVSFYPGPDRGPEALFFAARQDLFKSRTQPKN